MQKIITNLCIIHQHPKILLGMKKRGFGSGRWNGFGGKVADHESVIGSLHRELKEEANIEVENPVKLGILEFEFIKNGEVIEVHIFKASKFKGEPTETEEMSPKWFYVDEIPFADMWPDDIYWMPLFLKNKKFKGKFTFGENDSVLESNLEEVEDL